MVLLSFPSARSMLPARFSVFGRLSPGIVLLGEVQAGVFAEELDGLSVPGTGGFDLAVERAEIGSRAGALDLDVPLVGPVLVPVDPDILGGRVWLLAAFVVPGVLLRSADAQIAPAVVQNVLKSSLFHKYS